MWNVFLTRTYGHKALFTIEETRTILGCARQTVLQRIGSRQLDIRYIGSSRRVTRASLIEYLCMGTRKGRRNKGKKRKGDTMNFARLLFEGKDVTCAEIAAEIVTLEKALPELEANARKTTDAAKRLRQRKLGGKSVKTEEIKETEAEASEATKDFETAQATLGELNAYLLERAEIEREARIEELNKLRTAKLQEHRTRRDELLKEFAPFFIKWHEAMGGHRGAYRFELDCTAGADPKDRSVFRAEIERLYGEELKASQGLRGEAYEAIRKAQKLMSGKREAVAEQILKEARQAAQKQEVEKKKAKKEKATEASGESE